MGTVLGLCGQAVGTQGIFQMSSETQGSLCP